MDRKKIQVKHNIKAVAIAEKQQARMASEQVRLAGGKRLEVNTYENCRQIAYRRLRKQSRVENGNPVIVLWEGYKRLGID